MTIDSGSDRTPGRGVVVLVAARQEAELIAATLAGLEAAFPDARVWVADDGSSDGTGEIAREHGALVARAEGVGKGRAVTMAALLALAELEPQGPAPVFLLCDGDLGRSAVNLGPLVAAVTDGPAELAVAVFRRRTGGGLGLARGFARRAISRSCGLDTTAPISGQRALTLPTLRDVLPLADGFGMEIGMTIDATRAGRRLVEIELDLCHRATGRGLPGFIHRARQLLDFLRVYAARRRGRRDGRRASRTAGVRNLGGPER